MTKRIIEFQSKTYKKLAGKKVTVTISAPNYKLRQAAIKTDLGYFDVSVPLDRWGRLKAVLIEKTRSL